MTESIKQEIINNIFENGDKLITGPILQTVLIDMIDDVNVKDQAILSKTGSWDDAVTQIPNLATKEEVTNLSESVARDLENVVDVDLTGYATEQWVQNQGYLKEHQDISGLATKTELTEAENNLQGNITSLSESVARDLANVSVPEGVATEAWVQSQDYASKSYVDNAVSSSSVDLTGYATETWVESQGYLKEHQDISNLATKTELTSVSQSVQTDISNLATKGELNDTKNTLQGNITSLSESVARDLTGYATETWVESQGYLKEHQDISNLATKSELTSVSESVQTDITNLNESVANSAVWKKGTGTDSIVQKLTGVNETNTPTATGTGAIAIGSQTTASGLYSYAEGDHTVASGTCSHAEGNSTKAEGFNSHAKGYGTKASGMYSNAEGYNATASGDASHAEGESAEASGWGSHAEGSNTLASGSHSHAEGSSTNASGSYSHAEGTYVTASGYYSHAEGDNTKAEGESSHAEGYKASATGRYGHAEGDTSNASGLCSHAEGQSTLSSGQASHAEGFFTVASNDYEHAQGQYNHNSTNQIFSVGAGEKIGETVTRRNAVSILEVPNSETQVVTASFFVQNVGGYDGTNPEPGTNDLATVINNLPSGGSSETLWKKGEGQDSIAQIITTDSAFIQPKASGTGSIATGYYTEASGNWSHVEGSNAKASGSYSHAEGQSTNASGQASHAEGTGTKALGKFGSHAEGRDTEASGWGSHAEGQNTVASNQYSHAEGSGTKASGFYGHAEGGSTEASGFASHAEGSYTTASGGYSHAEGYGTKASSYYSHAEGYYTTTSNQYEHAQGRYNHNSSNQIFSIGAGDSIKDPDTQVVTETRRNAISVLAVDNSGSYTASFFVQNIGGYDGTNPEPGTNDLATVINGLSSGGGSSETLWKKGEGKDSIVQAIADGTNLPTATGERAIAIGKNTKALREASHAEGVSTNASGDYSHAEGQGTNALGQASHAEGLYAQASGMGSHTEGFNTIASNPYEHAQGRFNHNSENQIFSVGAGERVNGTTNRRNAVSVLAVDNSGSYTSSFFVQNIGGYDGTNPIPGTNDLATVLNNTETWTFTLEDGSTVTKNIRIS